VSLLGSRHTYVKLWRIWQPRQLQVWGCAIWRIKVPQNSLLKQS